MRTRTQIVVIVLVLVVHALGDLAMVTTGVTIRGGWELFIFAWPMSRVSLIALWVSISRARSYVRFPVAVVATAWALFVAMMAVDAPRDDEASAALATMFATQALIVFLAILAGQFLWRWGRLRQGSQCEDPLIPQYSLRFLLLWTTLLSIMLGAGRIVFARLEWTSDVVGWEDFCFFSMLGLHNAVFVLLVFASLVGRAWLFRRILIALVLIFAVGYFEKKVCLFTFGYMFGFPLADFLFLAGFQAAFLYATLLPLRFVGCFGGGKMYGPDSGE